MRSMDAELRSRAIQPPAWTQDVRGGARLVTVPSTDRRPGEAWSSACRDAFTARELEVLRTEHVTDRQSRQRALGRIAVKDVVRDLTRELGGPALRRTDVEVLRRPGCRPLVTVLREPAVAPISVSISHSGDRAVALGLRSHQVVGAGIDLEPVSSAAVIERMGLTSAERDALEDAPPCVRAQQVVSLWTAKEAAVKAWGTGFAQVGGPRFVQASFGPGGPGELEVAAVRRADLPVLVARTSVYAGFVMGIALWEVTGKSCAAAQRWRTVAPTTPQHHEECHA